MQNYKKKSIVQFALVVVLIVIINFLGHFFHGRIDLTSEKKYTLSEVSEQQLNDLQDIVFFKVYLDGDELPPGFKRLRNNIEEMLLEFKVLGGDNVQYEFVNPNENTNIKEKNQLFNELIGKGLTPTNTQERSEEGTISQKTFFAGALAYYQGEGLSINFLKNNPNLTPEQNLNNAIQDIEFNLMSTVKKLTGKQSAQVAFITGHGELNKAQTADLGRALKDYYSIERVAIDEKIYALSERSERDSSKWAVFNKYKAIIIAGATEQFSEKDKYVIDQYIMNGGNVLWLLNGTTANMDSLTFSSFTMAMPQKLNLEDMLFTYGVRINADLVQDMQCGKIPLDVSPIGSKYPDYKLFPWSFFPLTTGNHNSSITKNLNLVKLEFPSSIDTVGRGEKMKRTPLLFSSRYSKKLNAPVRVDLNIVNHPMKANNYMLKYLPMAYLLEGEFKSVFAKRLTKQFAGSSEIVFREKSRPAKMIVVADASIIRNGVRRTQRGYTPIPLEKDMYTGEVYGNKEFLLNAVNYLCDDSGILNMRNKEYKIRLLDKTKVQGHKTIWQIINIGLPLLLLSIFAMFNFMIRRKKNKQA